MPHDACILTTKDFTILEVMLDRSLAEDDAMTALLRRKLDAATVVFRDDVPPQVATLSSRLSFLIDGRGLDSRILSHDRMSAPVGLYLPVTALRGLALLGLVEGQAIRVPNGEDAEESILLEKVLYQPEAARREREVLAIRATPEARRTMLRVIPGAPGRTGSASCNAARVEDDDGPGPSAA